MFAHATHATDPHDPDQQAEDAQLYRHVLHDLISIGTDLARLLHQDAIAHAMQQAKAIHTAPPATPGIAITFDRTARAVRRCIALARSLAHPVPPPRPAQARTAARQRTLRAVEDTTQDAPGHGTSADAPEDLHPEPRERPDAPDPDDSLAGRPVAEIIASICRDLGLHAPPGAYPEARHTREDTAPSAHAAAPSTPNPPSPAQGPDRGSTTPHPPSPQPPQPVPTGPPAIPHPPGQAEGNAPDGASGLETAALHHPAHAWSWWRPPPGS